MSDNGGLMRFTVVRVLGLGSLIVSAAACVRYHPKPLSAPAAADAFENRSLSAPELAAFIKSRSGIETWPPDVWDLHALTLTAIYYHPDLDVARAQWSSAQAARKTAGERPNPAASVLMGYNATTPASEVTPWIPEAALEIPVETAGKRGYRIAEARHLSDAARRNILSVAWQIRSRLRRAYLEFYSAHEAATLLDRQLGIQEASLRILEAQLDAGEVSPAEVTRARISLDQSRLAALDAVSRAARARIDLAAAVGLPAKALEGARLPFEDMAAVRLEIPTVEAQRQALLHRSDILSALSEYAASDAALRLEIAKQYPDISLLPDYQLDQTDSKWTLGLSLILPLLNRNKGPIAEAEARRDEAAARFLSLQAAVISEIGGAVSAARSAAEKASTAADLLAGLRRQEVAAQARYEAGEISRLELLGLQLEIATGGLARLDALVAAQGAVGDLEDAMQSPLDLEAWAFNPAPGAPRPGSGKEIKDD
jgi:cobalt-zinc-cadmium efflux system outer membrane protein